LGGGQRAWAIARECVQWPLLYARRTTPFSTKKDSAKKKYFAYKKRKDCLCRITKMLHELKNTTRNTFKS